MALSVYIYICLCIVFLLMFVLIKQSLAKAISVFT